MTLFPVGRQQVADVIHQTEGGQFLLDVVGSGVFEPVGNLGDQQLGKLHACPAELLAECLGRDRLTRLFRQSLGQLVGTRLGKLRTQTQEDHRGRAGL